MIKKHIIVPLVIALASGLAYIGFRFRGFRHAEALYMLRELKASKGL
jgi:hypothetical protein